jgi:hypothetical protein
MVDLIALLDERHIRVLYLSYYCIASIDQGCPVRLTGTSSEGTDVKHKTYSSSNFEPQSAFVGYLYRGRLRVVILI